MNKITFTKKDIVKRVAKKTHSSVERTVPYVEEMFTTLRELMCVDEDYVRIEVRNFGVFEVKPTKAKPRARNPRTNVEVYVPAHKKTHFKPGKILKEFLSRPL
jgi:integration host factor subunit beta